MLLVVRVSLHNQWHSTKHTVVTQYYEADVNKEHVIRGNAAVIKCLIPSFVADFVEVISWHTDQEENFFPASTYGSSAMSLLDLHPQMRTVCNVGHACAMTGNGFFFLFLPHIPRD